MYLYFLWSYQWGPRLGAIATKSCHDLSKRTETAPGQARVKLCQKAVSPSVLHMDGIMRTSSGTMVHWVHALIFATEWASTLCHLHFRTLAPREKTTPVLTNTGRAQVWYRTRRQRADIPSKFQIVRARTRE